MTSLYMLLLIVCCAIVTWIPRIVPFVLVKRFDIPLIVRSWLGYIPICILSALIFESLFVKRANYMGISMEYLLALILTVMLSIWTKSLAKTVICGVLLMAGIRMIL
jgi:branched-subunit amino acid transport protein